MATLRQKQNMEILDVFKDINNQVVQRQLRQISVFPDTLKPKTERDLGAEVNVDKAVEQINRTLEQKLGSLEFYLQNIRRINDPKFSQSVIQSQEQSTNSGDVIPLYNTISRISHQTGISRESRQVIRIQLQALTPNLDAITYGLQRAIQSIMKDIEENAEQVQQQEQGSKSSTSAVLDFLRTYAVYQFIRKQVDKDNTSSVELLTVEALNAEFRNSFEMLSQNDIQIIKERIPNANWLLSRGMANVPDFPVDDYEGRIKALEDELGFKIQPTLRASLKGLPLHAQKEALVKLKNEERRGDLRLTQAEIQMIRQAELVAQQNRDLTDELERMAQMTQLLLEQADMLRRGVQVDPDRAAEEYQLAPEIQVRQVAPDFLAAPSLEAYKQSQEKFKQTDAQWVERRAEVDRIVAENEMIQTLVIPDLSQAQREEAIREKLEMVEAIANRVEALKSKQEEVQAKEQQLVEQSSAAANPAVAAIVGRKPTSVPAPPEVAAARTALVDEIRRLPSQLSSDSSSLVDTLENERMIDSIRARVRAFNDANPAYKIQISPNNPPRLLVKKQPNVAPKAPPAPVVDDEKEMSGDGFSSRGLGSLRRNYGFRESESEEESEESDSDPLDFDDRRNEHYYTRPR